MATIIRPKNHDAWLEARKAGIGSSEVGIIMGLSSYETPYQLWRRKMGLDAPKEQNFAMKAGHYLEDAVSKFYADETGKEIIKASQGDWLIVDENKPFLRVSPDRTFWLPNMAHNNENKGILECKTTQRNVDEDSIPLTWFAQLQYQLGVSGYQQGALAWLIAGRTFGFMDMNFDAEFYEIMVESVTKFWVDNIQGGIEPDAITAEDVIIKYPSQIAGKSAIATNEILSKYNELKALKSLAKEQSERIKELENDLKLAIGDCESLISSESKVLATFKASKAANKFDEKSFKADNQDMYNSYCHEVAGSRRFLLK